jgi:hypothetical protein
MNETAKLQPSRLIRFARICCGFLGFLSAWVALIPVAIYSVNVPSKLLVGGLVELFAIAVVSYFLHWLFPKAKPYLAPFAIMLLATLLLIFSAVSINWEIRYWRLSHGATLGMATLEQFSPSALRHHVASTEFAK